MNERIQALAKQAMKDTSMSFAERWDRVHRSEFMEVYNQKFANLIIQECSRIADAKAVKDPWAVGATIKQQFGVQ